MSSEIDLNRFFIAHQIYVSSLTTHLPPYYSPVYNPASPSLEEPHRSAGGSSGGSAAAVAEGSCDA